MVTWWRLGIHVRTIGDGVDGVGEGGGTIAMAMRVSREEASILHDRTDTEMESQSTISRRQSHNLEACKPNASSRNKEKTGVTRTPPTKRLD